MSYKVCSKCGIAYNEDLIIQNKEYIKYVIKNLNNKKRQQQFEKYKNLTKEIKNIIKQNNLLKEKLNNTELLNKLDDDDIDILKQYIQIKEVFYLIDDKLKLIEFCQDYYELLNETTDEIIEENSI